MKTSTTLRRVEIAAFRDLTPDVREFTLRLLDGQAAPAWQPGAHVEVHLTQGDASMIRHYSLLPCSEPACLRIAVKQAAHGRGGSQALWRLALGDALHISMPVNHFPLYLNAPQYLLIAGGIGITPLLSMATQLKARGAAVAMIYAARAGHWAYRDVLQKLLGEHVQFIAGADLQPQAALAHLTPEAQAYVCGPTGLLQAMRQAWASAKRPAHLLRYENFGAARSDRDSNPFEIRLPRHQLQFEVQPSVSMLEAIEQRGISAISGCKRGECGLCALRVLDLNGSIDHRDVFLSDAQKSSNEQICICVSRVSGSISLDTAYRPETL
jgi:ferredoxin-NADP reductase